MLRKLWMFSAEPGVGLIAFLCNLSKIWMCFHDSKKIFMQVQGQHAGTEQGLEGI